MAVNDIRLFNEDTLKKYRDAATREDMREKNCFCITYLLYLLTREDSEKNQTTRQRLYNSLAGKELGKKSKYQEALDFFISKQSALVNSQFAHALIELFEATKKKSGEEHSLLAQYFNAKGSAIDYNTVEEPNIIKLAEQFSKAFGNEKAFGDVDIQAAQAIKSTIEATQKWGEEKKAENNM